MKTDPLQQKRSIREVARQHMASKACSVASTENQGSHQIGSATEPRNDQQTPKPGTPQIVGHEKVTCTCGHEVDFPLFEEKKDKFREQRCKNICSRPCAACRQEKHQRKMAEEAAARKTKPKKTKNFQQTYPGRLPHAAHFDVTYSAAGSTWTGSLSVPEGDHLKVFSGTASGVFKLMRYLDAQYREYADSLIKKGE